MPGGSASASTLRPTLSAVVGSTLCLDDLVEAELVGPELFVAEGIEAENLFALGLKIHRFGTLAGHRETQDRRSHETSCWTLELHIGT